MTMSSESLTGAVPLLVPEVEVEESEPAPRRTTYNWPGMLPFVLSHVAVLGAFWSGVTWQALALCFALYLVRMWAVTAGYHRYFAHRSFETSRPFAFFL